MLAAAMNFKRMMNIWKDNLLALFLRLIEIFTELTAAPKKSMPYYLLTF